MKFMKYVLVLLVACCAITSVSNAQTVVWVGGGSSALFLEVGQAAFAFENPGIGAQNHACVWSSAAVASGSDIASIDSRPSSPDIQLGKIWVVWNKGTGTCAIPTGSYNIYAYMSLDSVLGDRCFFEVDKVDNKPGCIVTMTPSGAEAALQGTNYLANTACPGDPMCDTAALPAAVSGALNGQHWDFAGTDVRPEDAKFASLRMFTPCGQQITRQPFDQGLHITYGLGYQTGVTGVGTTIQDSFASTLFTVLDFNITGNDPINTAFGVPPYQVTTVGAQPIIVSVSPAGAGSAWANATDINTFTLANFYNGSLGRTQDIIGGASGGSVQAVETLVREPLSGTYQTFEYSVPNTVQFHTSQDDGNCSGNVVGSNPMLVQAINGANVGTSTGYLGSGYPVRRRVIGTGEMTKYLQAATSTDPRLGYWFWSAGNAAKFTATNGKYLTVNGVDPLLNSYSSNPVSPGVLPVGAANLASVTFAGLQAGDYSVWSALRLVTNTTPPAGLANILSGLGTINPTQHDYVPPASLTAWHSHFYIPSINIYAGANGNVALDVPTVGTGTSICTASGALSETGSDVGGANVYTQANYDFCLDFSSVYGLVNKTN
ncbi:MAG: hypothetical protein ACLPXB_15395 [Thiobacillaceae bacterium]